MQRASITVLITVAVTVTALVGSLVAGNRPLLGLDLQGGLSVVLQAVDDEVESESLDQAIEIIRQRVDGIGVGEPDITRQGDSIVVQLPGIEDADEALELVGQTAELRFRPVRQIFPATVEGAEQARAALAALRALEGGEEVEDLVEDGLTDPGDESDAEAAEDAAAADDAEPAPDETAPDETAPDETAPDETDETAPDETAPDETDETAPDETDETAPDETDETAPDETDETAPDETDETVTDDGELTAEDRAAAAEVITEREDDTVESFVLLPDLDGETIYLLGPAQVAGPDGELVPTTGVIVDSAEAALDPRFSGAWQVALSFTDEGSPIWDAVAAANFQNLLAIALDGVVYSAPQIQQPSFGGSGQITGDFSESEAKDLALVLRFGALPVELEPATVQTVSATLGSDALTAGVIAGLIGLALVGVFMFAYYRFLGLVAVGGLIISGSLLWSMIALLGETQGLALTLAGATGIIVSIGVQVDSNIVYAERLKEELRRGRSLRVGADSGFRDAFSTIVKADVASLIGAGVLYWLTVGPVRGFALFLGLATILDLVVSYLFMRPMTLVLARSRRFDSRKVIGVDPTTRTGAPA